MSGQSRLRAEATCVQGRAGSRGKERENLSVRCDCKSFLSRPAGIQHVNKLLYETSVYNISVLICRAH